MIIPWLLLLGALLLRENRNRRAWIMALPAVVYMVAFTVLPVDMYRIFAGFFAAVAIAWLLSERLARRKPITAIAFVFGLFISMGLLELLRYVLGDPSRIQPPNNYVTVLAFTGCCYILGLLLHLGALLGGRYACRRQYTPSRFRIALLLCHASPVIFILPLIFFGSLFQFAISITLMSLLELAMMSPFLLIVFTMPFHKMRFLALFRLKEDVCNKEVVPLETGVGEVAG